MTTDLKFQPCDDPTHNSVLYEQARGYRVRRTDCIDCARAAKKEEHMSKRGTLVLRIPVTVLADARDSATAVLASACARINEGSAGHEVRTAAAHLLAAMAAGDDRRDADAPGVTVGAMRATWTGETTIPGVPDANAEPTGDAEPTGSPV